eukprot:m51a1_g13037 hypothetical protein (706) ;mRNA; f:606-2849
MCLGQICEEVEQSAIANHTNTILTAVVSSAAETETNPAVKFAAINALLNSLEFAKANFEHENERTYIMRVVVAATKAAEVKLRAKAFECLCRIANLYYDKLAVYMQAIFDATITSIKNTAEDETVALQAIEFWSNLAEIEAMLRDDEEMARDEGRELAPSDKSQNFVTGAMAFLFEALSSCMLRQEEDQDEDAWNVSLAAATCLSLVALCVRDAVVQPVFGFVAANIESADWHAREAATVAFGTVLEGPDSLGSILANGQALGVLVKHLQDSVEIVRDSSAWAIGRLASTLPEVVAEPKERLDGVVSALMAGLKDSERVACTCAWALNNIAEAVALMSDSDEPPATGPFSRFFPYVVAELFRAADRQDVDEAKLRRAAFGAMAEIVHSCAGDCVAQVAQLLSEIARRLAESAAEDTQVLLVSVMSESIKRLGAAGLAQIPGAADSIMALLLRLFQGGRGAALQEEALMAIGEIANATEEAFGKYTDLVMQPLMVCLRNRAEYEVCGIAVGVVGDICRAIGAAFAPHAQGVMQALMEDLQAPELNRSVKPIILSCVGDVAVAIKSAFVPYLSTTMAMLAQASALQVNTDDDDQVDYLNKLRESIFEAYTGIIHGMNGGGLIDQLAPFVPTVLEIVKHVYSDATRNDAVTVGLVGLIGDLAQTMGERLRPFPVMAQIKQIVADISSSPTSTKAVTLAKWAKELLQRV